MKILFSIDRALAKFEGWLIILFLGLMVCLTFLQVLLRSLYIKAHLTWANVALGHLDWTEPFVRLLVLWITFLGASLLTGENKHIKIDLMSAMLPARMEPYRGLILSLACVVISALMVKASIGYIRIEMEYSGLLFLNIPNWIGELILPIGFCTILFRFILMGIGQGLDIIRGIKG